MQLIISVSYSIGCMQTKPSDLNTYISTCPHPFLWQMINNIEMTYQ